MLGLKKKFRIFTGLSCGLFPRMPVSWMVLNYQQSMEKHFRVEIETVVNEIPGRRYCGRPSLEDVAKDLQT